MVGVGPVLASPHTHVQARGRDPTRAHPQGMGPRAAQRMLDLNLERQRPRRKTADANVAAAVDDDPRVAAERLGDDVGRQALSGAAGVEDNPRRPRDHTLVVVDLDRLPPAIAIRRRRPARGGQGQRLGQAGRCHARARARVADRLELAHQRRVNEAIRALGCPQPGLDRASQKLRRLHDRARIGVEGAELAVGAKARQGAVEPGDELLRLFGRKRGRAQAASRRADYQAHLAAHGLEGDVALVHDELLTTGADAAGAGAGEGAGAVEVELDWVAVPPELATDGAPEPSPRSATTRVSTMRRTRTGLGGEAGDTGAAPPSAGSLP